MACAAVSAEAPAVCHRAKRIFRMDYRRRRLRNTLLLGTAFLAGAAIGPASGLIASHFVPDLGINAALAQDTDRANTYRLLSLFGDVFERVRSEYVDPVFDKELVENAIDGMLTGLDPHSAYMNADEFQEMQVETTGVFGGIGIQVVPENGFMKVISPMDDTPASKAGIKSGDMITRVDGNSVQGLSLDNMIDAMRGPPDPKVTLTIEREGVDKPLEISMRREVIHYRGGEATDGAGQHRLCAAH
jgi:carboxyl-terminal processing protease